MSVATRDALSRNAGVPACEFGRRLAARSGRRRNGGVSLRHRDGARTRSRGRLRYMPGRLHHVTAAPFPIFDTVAQAGVYWIHQSVVAAAMQIFVVSDEVFVRFALPK